MLRLTPPQTFQDVTDMPPSSSRKRRRQEDRGDDALINSTPSRRLRSSVGVATAQQSSIADLEYRLRDSPRFCKAMKTWAPAAFPPSIRTLAVQLSFGQLPMVSTPGYVPKLAILIDHG